MSLQTLKTMRDVLKKKAVTDALVESLTEITNAELLEANAKFLAFIFDLKSTEVQELINAEKAKRGI